MYFKNIKIKSNSSLSLSFSSRAHKNLARHEFFEFENMFESELVNKFKPSRAHLSSRVQIDLIRIIQHINHNHVEVNIPTQ